MQWLTDQDDDLERQPDAKGKENSNLRLANHPTTITAFDAYIFYTSIIAR